MTSKSLPKRWVDQRGQSRKHGLRVRRTLLVWSTFMVIASLGWAVYFCIFGISGALVNVGLNVLLAVVALGAAQLTLRGYTRIAALTLVSSLFAALFMICLVQDIPSAQAPRSAHHYFLVLGMVTFLMFKGEALWLRHGVPLLCLTKFFVFTSTRWGLTTPYVLPDALRIPGTWINNASALIALYALHHIMLQSSMPLWRGVL